MAGNVMKDISARIKPVEVGTARARDVWFGEGGVGKTTLAGTYPKPLFIDLEDGLVPVALEATKATRFRPESFEDLRAVYFTVKKNPDLCDTIVLDSIGEESDALLAEARSQDDASVNLAEFRADLQHYLLISNALKIVLNDFKALGKHVVVIAGIKVEDGGFRRPMVPGKVAEVLRYWSNRIGELDIRSKDGKDFRVLDMRPTPKRAAKNRFSKVMPSIITEPTFDKLWTPVQAALDAAAKGGKQ